MIKIQDIILTAIVIHSITLAMGLFWIYTTQSRVNEEILKRNYKLAEKNSLYKFNEGIGSFLKALIPFYYFVLGLNIIKDSGDYKNTVAKAIASGKYEPIDFENRKKIEPVISTPEPKVEFELTKEKFKARKNDSSIYNPDETPMEYSERIMSYEETMTTPYIEATPVLETQKSSDLSIEESTYKASKIITPEEMASYISKLNKNDLRSLQDIIDQLISLKEQSYQRTLEKDVA